MSAPIRITLNGAPREFPAPLTFAELLDGLALAGKRLAVERNGEIVPRSSFNRENLNDGDRIELDAVAVVEVLPVERAARDDLAVALDGQALAGEGEPVEEFGESERRGEFPGRPV